MANIDEKTRAKLRERIAGGDFDAAMEHNRKAKLLARPGECGGCFGAGKGARCCICGGRR